jgi:hypothetical protein
VGFKRGDCRLQKGLPVVHERRMKGNV